MMYGTYIYLSSLARSILLPLKSHCRVLVPWSRANLNLVPRIATDLDTISQIMLIQSLNALTLMVGWMVAQSANSLSLDPVKDYCFRFDHQCL